ncbi:carbohydrate ABC transporter permease [Paenibacillus sp. 1001270B_150601_E10]|uniref:carbohydrate ABC transporter permease n=1 Tax=Paenibacillus sp. 1001270B_150601_E10 TaxID=2787079 RepID=UPI00189D4494|nr:carbohydrate ABC transporter permease [Paenibacillus sp. 1001270B_150601_E10]
MDSPQLLQASKSRPAPETKRLTVAKVLVILFLSLLVVTQLYPLLWLFLYSLKTNEEILSGSFFSLPETLQWSNYEVAFESGNYVRYLGNSLLVTSVTMFGVILLSSMTAYAISRFRWRCASAVMLLFLIGMMIPLQSTLLPLMLIFKQVKLLNTHGSLILPYMAFSMPIAIFILSGFMKTIPLELEESALMDGAGVFRIFRSMLLPISVPPMMTVCILTFITIWNEYILAATFISSERLKTLPFGVNSFVSQYSVNYGAIGAFLVLGALPVILMYFLLADKITQGMLAGAVKG